jgi:preprotein translocase subunit YajC
VLVAAQAGGGGSFTPLLLIVLPLRRHVFPDDPPAAEAAPRGSADAVALGPGDQIVTIGGLHGTVVAIATMWSPWRSRPGVDVKFARPAIARVLKQDASAAEEPPADDLEPEEPAVEPPAIESPIVETRKSKD